MLTRSQLLQLEQSLRGKQTLSVYLNGWTDDPAQRDAWRIELKNAVQDRRNELRNASHASREAFDDAANHLWAHLESVPGVLGDPGWVAFVTPHGIAHAESVPIDLPTRVNWGEGIQLAPYMRLRKQSVPAIVAVVDASEARLYRFAAHRLRKVEKLHAHKHMEEPQHMGRPSRSGFHSGTRGPTGADATDRARLSGRAAMLRELAERLVAGSEPDGWILIGGIPGVVDAALNALPGSYRRRAHRLASLDVHATDAEIEAAAERGATAESRQRDAACIDEIISLSLEGGRGLTGWKGTLEALQQRAVNRLFFTERFLVEHPVEVEQGVTLALEQDAEVDQVSGLGAERLDAAGEGIGVRLRFLPTREQAPLLSSTAVP